MQIYNNLQIETQMNKLQLQSNSNKTTYIGNLPISVYENSPKKYQSNDFSLLNLTKSGISTKVDEQNITDVDYDLQKKNISNFDYFYEFSETRKVLDEFFKSPLNGNNNKNMTTENRFEELDYDLKRFHSDRNNQFNDYIGKRLAFNNHDNSNKNSLASSLNESPFPINFKKNSNETINLKQSSQEPELVTIENKMIDFFSNNFNDKVIDTDRDYEDIDEKRDENENNENLLTNLFLNNSNKKNEQKSNLIIENQILDNNFGLENPIIQSLDDLITSSTRINDDLKLCEENYSLTNSPLFNYSNHVTNEKNDNRSESSMNDTDDDVIITPPSPAPHNFSLNNFLDVLPLNNLTNNTITSSNSNASNSNVSKIDDVIKDICSTLKNTKKLHNNCDKKFDDNLNSSPIWIPRYPSSENCTSLDSKTEDNANCDEDIDTDLETDRLLGEQRSEEKKPSSELKNDAKRNNKNLFEPSVLVEGVLFRASYLGSTQIACKGQPTKSTRMMQAEEAVARIKAPDGEIQPSTEVDLFISTEKIMVLNTDAKEVMMDHNLRTISYIADIGNLVVLMARRKISPHEIDDTLKLLTRTPKMICHIFESDEAQYIAQSIGQAFQIAYMEFLQANGIEDNSFVKEMDYQEVLNSQEIFGDELNMFAKKELQKEVIVPKAKNEILGVVIVESGWGSMLPTVVLANLSPSGPASRCSQLNIGDQIIAINGISLVGLPLSTCQNYIKNTKYQTVVKLTVVPCAPVVEVKIKRPETKYQLGFSVQNGVICSLLRGGIAERGGVRVGHRIIEINNQSVVAVPHEKIVNLLATSVGEILMKTMPTSMFRLLTGQENPMYI